MKTTIITLLVALTALFTLSSCDGTQKIYSEPINFYLSADCNEEGVKKIVALYKKIGLPVGEKITISVIVDIKSTIESNKIELEKKVKDILTQSSTRITAGDFHTQKTGATMTIYSARYSSDDKEIGQVITNFSNVPYSN